MIEKDDRFRTTQDHPRKLDCPKCEYSLTACQGCDDVYYSCCDWHVIYGTDGLTLAASHSASDIARALGTLANPADRAGLQFGKIFEKEYQQYWYRRQRGGFDGYGSLKHAYFPKRVFSRRIAYRLREEEIYSSDRMAHAVSLRF